MSALHSMTGFARASSGRDDLAWVWEARSVNGRGLDVRVRTPKGFDGFEALARAAFSAVFTRGNIQVSLTLSRAAGASAFAVDEALLSQLQTRIGGGGDALALSNLLTVPGVLMARSLDDAHESYKADIAQTLESCVSKLQAVRQSEGQALTPVLTGAVETLEALTAQASTLAAAQPDVIKAKFEQKFAALMGDKVDTISITSEAALLAMKADIREELDRLRAHCEQAKSHLTGGSPIGRKLEFLAQEFNREINTLCSKSADIDLTRIGLEMKSMNEQFREQAANVE